MTDIVIDEKSNSSKDVILPKICTQENKNDSEKNKNINEKKNSATVIVNKPQFNKLPLNTIINTSNKYNSKQNKPQKYNKKRADKKLNKKILSKQKCSLTSPLPLIISNKKLNKNKKISQKSIKRRRPKKSAQTARTYNYKNKKNARIDGSQSSRKYQRIQLPLQPKSKLYYTPRMDELPLSLRLHSNPIMLVHSLRRQKMSNYQMYKIKPVIDNQLSRRLREYSERKNELRNRDPYPHLSAPVFLKKQYQFEVLSSRIKKHKQHLSRIHNIKAHIDNHLPAQIQRYRSMRLNRLKNAQKRAKKIHKKRLQFPLKYKRKIPKPPSYELNPAAKAVVSAVRKSQILLPSDLNNSMMCNSFKEEKKIADKTRIESIDENIEDKLSDGLSKVSINTDMNEKNDKSMEMKKNVKKQEVMNEVVYIDQETARMSVFTPSPKTKKYIGSPVRVVQALPCHFKEWEQ